MPFAYFLPQPIESIGAIVTILFQAMIMASGNLSFLNLLTIVIAIPALDDGSPSPLPARRYARTARTIPGP